MSKFFFLFSSSTNMANWSKKNLIFICPLSTSLDTGPAEVLLRSPHMLFSSLTSNFWPSNNCIEYKHRVSFGYFFNNTHTCLIPNVMNLIVNSVFQMRAHWFRPLYFSLVFGISLPSGLVFGFYPYFSVLLSRLVFSVSPSHLVFGVSLPSGIWFFTWVCILSSDFWYLSFHVEFGFWSK